MRTTAANPALWLLALTALVAVAGAVRHDSARQSAQRVMRWATTTPVLALTVILALGGLGSRAVLGYLSPGTYAEEVVGARAFLAERQLYNGDERAEFGKWLTEAPPVIAPWTLPGITTCQASAMEQRPRFFTSQAHMPTLLLSSVPVVHLVGGRGLYLVLVIGFIAAIVAMVGVVLREGEIEWRSRLGILGFAAIAGWQPVLAGIRQGDAALMAAALVALCWHFVRRGRMGPAGLVGGAAACLVLPALGTLPALWRSSRSACVIALSICLGGLAAAVAAGGLMVMPDFADALAVTARTYAQSMPNYAIIGRANLAGMDTWILLGAFLVAALLSAWRGRTADAAFGTFTVLGLLAAPVVWSQQLTLALVPLAVVFRRVCATGTSLALAAWAVLAALLSLPDPAVASLSGLLAPFSPTAAMWPVVPGALLVLWAWLLLDSDVAPAGQPSSAVGRVLST